MQGEAHRMTADQAKAFAANRAAIAHAVESLQKHDGWKIFFALFEQEKKKIQEKSNYRTIQAFRSDRKAIKIVESIIGEFEGYRDDAAAAQDLLNDIIAQSDNQTPQTYSLSDFGAESQEQG